MGKSFLKFINLTFIMIIIMSAKVYALENLKVDTFLEYTKTFNIDEEKDLDDISFNAINNNKNKNQGCLNVPEAGKDTKVVDKDKSFDIIDYKDGWYLIDIEDKPYLISCQDITINEEGKGLTKSKLILNTGKEMCDLKIGQAIEVVEKKDRYVKVKTLDGFKGWINAKSIEEENGLVILKEDTKSYYSMEYIQMDNIKRLQKGESVKKLDERKDYILVECDGRLSWISKANLNIQGENISLKNNEKIYEAASDYTYEPGEVVRVVDGSFKDFIKVLTPRGNLAWIKKENLIYDNNRKLVCSKSTKAYYTGNLKGNTIKEKGSLMADIAYGEVGYIEGENNKTKYGDWYGLNAEWCGIFVSWCSFSAGITQDIVPKSSYCKDSAEWFMNNKNWYSKDQYLPKKGDIIYFYVKGDINHIGIVYEVTEDSVITIEGNMSNKVLKMTHKINDENIAGYASPIL